MNILSFPGSTPLPKDQLALPPWLISSLGFSLKAVQVGIGDWAAVQDNDREKEDAVRASPGSGRKARVGCWGRARIPSHARGECRGEQSPSLYVKYNIVPHLSGMNGDTKLF